MSEIKLWMVFEALGPKKDDVVSSLEDHLEKLRSEDDLEIVNVEKDQAEKMQDPHPELDEGYSKVTEVTAEAQTFTRAIKTVINYGPTYVQIDGPEKFEMGISDMQNSLQEVASTMQKYAQMGVGGVLLSRPEKED